MKKKFDIKKFLTFFITVIVLFFIADIVFDAFKGKIVWAEIFSTNNLLLKLAAGVIGGGIFAFKDEKSDSE
jgi:hypothetical protein